MSAKSIAAVPGGPEVSGKHVSTVRDLEAAVADDLPKSALDRPNLQTGETIERIARLYAMALDAFIDPAAAVRFGMVTHLEPGDRSPFETALTELGGRAVEEVIERGLHGLPA